MNQENPPMPMAPEALGEKELLALVLRAAGRAADAAALAQELLAAFPQGLAGVGYEEFSHIRGLGKRQAAALAAALEIARRWMRKRDLKLVLDSPLRVAEQIPSDIRESRKEHFLAFYLNARNQLIRLETVSVGTLSASLVHPREVFAPAITHCAAALIVAHNHPSGDCSPSSEDKDTTGRLCRSGTLLGIPLLDHLIVSGDGDFYSFKEHGLLA